MSDRRRALLLNRSDCFSRETLTRLLDVMLVQRKTDYQELSRHPRRAFDASIMSEPVTPASHRSRARSVPRSARRRL